ncbi:efflux RND transporter periplasmic adaptor subunit [Desulfogranum japonicum]|uniref:efflux RND transporter periplasmic adaptor subunit n=1 Tax=Desulfogranum japonicum TaxID=231447 RepID=UPI00048ED9C9|nr:efflux RND transporter periplasmic adaptor subunit [Desulfogranum japonicum]
MQCLRKLVLSLFLFASLSACNENQQAEQKPQQPPPMPVEVITVKQENIPIWLEYTGKTEATRRIEVRARIGGRLEQVTFNEGDVVEQGQILFVIEKDSYEAALAKAKATLQKNKASLALAKADVARYKPLVAEGLAPRATLEQYIARQGELEAIIIGDEAAIRDARLNLDYTEVVAPVTGRISRKLVDVGNIVGYGETTLLTTIIVDNPIYSYFNPTEEEFQIMRQYRDKDSMDARVRVPDTMAQIVNRPHFTGHVDFTDNKVDPMTGTITMRAIIDNPEHFLLEGTFVYTEIFLTGKSSFITIPPEVVFDDQLGSYVYTVGEQNTATKTYIERGHDNRYMLVVQKGLDEGTRVIINGLARLQEGIRVEPDDVTDTKSVLAVFKEKGMIPK